MPHRALRVTSPNNAWALSIQIISVIIPLLAVLDIYEPAAISEWGLAFADVWQVILLASSTVAFISASLLLKSAYEDGNRLRAVLRLECFNTFIMAVCYLVLFSALVAVYGFLANPLTQVLIGGLGLGGVARVLQILWGLSKSE